LTSAEPDEGKTTLALNLAQTDARLGRRVLLVDADFRRSEVADILELRKSPGLIDVLTERARFEDAVQADRSGAHVLVAGGFEPSASEMLVLRNLAPLLNLLRQQYDLIIFDAPPVISLVDAAVVAGFVDRTILVVRWAGTRRSVVSHALNEIAAAGGTVGGVILSMVNVKEHALYSFGDSGQYHGRYKKYYDVA
jgi:capsular exopolysaccharide synthesis family protein